MILVRDIFQLKFGKAKDAVASIKRFDAIRSKHGITDPVRFLTDLTGPYYTLVMETTFENLGSFESMMKNETGGKEFGEWYAGFVPLVDSGRREIFTIV